MKNFTRFSAALACFIAVAAAAPAHAYEGDMVRLSQHRLSDLGFFSGHFDGVLGPMTIASLRDFQAANGLWVNGQLDSQTYNLLVSMDYRIWNGSATHIVYTTAAYQQPAVIHYANANAFATRYVQPTPVAYYNSVPVQYVAATTTAPVYYNIGGAPDMTEVSYNTVCYGVDNEYTNCR